MNSLIKKIPISEDDCFEVKKLEELTDLLDNGIPSDQIDLYYDLKVDWVPVLMTNPLYQKFLCDYLSESSFFVEKLILKGYNIKYSSLNLDTLYLTSLKEGRGSSNSGALQNKNFLRFLEAEIIKNPSDFIWLSSFKDERYECAGLKKLISKYNLFPPSKSNSKSSNVLDTVMNTLGPFNGFREKQACLRFVSVCYGYTKMTSCYSWGNLSGNQKRWVAILLKDKKVRNVLRSKILQNQELADLLTSEELIEIFRDDDGKNSLQINIDVNLVYQKPSVFLKYICSESPESFEDMPEKLKGFTSWSNLLLKTVSYFMASLDKDKNKYQEILSSWSLLEKIKDAEDKPFNTVFYLTAKENLCINKLIFLHSEDVNSQDYIDFMLTLKQILFTKRGLRTESFEINYNNFDE